MNMPEAWVRALLESSYRTEASACKQWPTGLPLASKCLIGYGHVARTESPGCSEYMKLGMCGHGSLTLLLEIYRISTTKRRDLAGSDMCMSCIIIMPANRNTGGNRLPQRILLPVDHAISGHTCSILLLASSFSSVIRPPPPTQLPRLEGGSCLQVPMA